MDRTIGYKREYKMRRIVPGRKYVIVGMPYEVVEREATIRDLTVDQFIKEFVMVAEYDNFDGIRYTFKAVSHDNGS